ncbi:MAG: glycosyltransferase [Gammaproteobacteria bacterium]|nr:glycosyltransferase [Gammaproteobacteria bacterium]
MRVLMYGWEFPPRISGGLGVACYAIVKELARQNVNVTLVLPFAMQETSQINGTKFITCDNHADTASCSEHGTVDIKYTGLPSALTPYFSSMDLQKVMAHANLKDLLQTLKKINLPAEIKQIIETAIHSADLSTISGKYGMGLLAEVLNYALLAGSLARNNPHDVIHAHDWLTVLAAVEAKQISRKPLIFHIHALETDRSGEYLDQRIYAIEKYGMEQADRVITVSQYTKNMAIKHYGIPAEKISVVHNGTYFSTTNFAARANPERPKMVLFLGRITQQKGPYFFVKIAEKILKQRKDIQFVLVGTGDLFRDMIEKVAELRIGTNVHFTGFLANEQVKQMFALADVYVMPSVSEPFGLSCLEALVHQVPVVISKQSGVAEVLKNVLVADFWDVDDMAAKVLAMLEYKVLHKTSLNQSYAEVAHLTWSKTAEAILRVYNQLQRK